MTHGKGGYWVGVLGICIDWGFRVVDGECLGIGSGGGFERVKVEMWCFDTEECGEVFELKDDEWLSVVCLKDHHI